MFPAECLEIVVTLYRNIAARNRECAWAPKQKFKYSRQKKTAQNLRNFTVSQTCSFRRWEVGPKSCSPKSSCKGAQKIAGNIDNVSEQLHEIFHTDQKTAQKRSIWAIFYSAETASLFFCFQKNRGAVFLFLEKQRGCFCKTEVCQKSAQTGSFWPIFPVSKSQHSIVTSYSSRFNKICVHLDYAVVDKVYEFRIERQIGDGQCLCRQVDKIQRYSKDALVRSKSTILCFSKTASLFFCFQKNRGTVFLFLEKQRGCFCKTEVRQNMPKLGRFSRFYLDTKSSSICIRSRTVMYCSAEKRRVGKV